MRLTVGARSGFAALVLVVIVGTLMLARPADAAQTEIVLRSGSGTSTFMDVKHDGLRLGDRLTARFSLMDPTAASKVGNGHLDCVVQRHITDGPEGPGGLYRCSYLLRLADGSIIIEGLDPHGPGVYSMAVLGGTGAFAGATGEATLTDGSEGTEFVISLVA